jgi:hypothetical protein
MNDGSKTVFSWDADEITTVRGAAQTVITITGATVTSGVFLGRQVNQVIAEPNPDLLKCGDDPDDPEGGVTSATAIETLDIGPL